MNPNWPEDPKDRAAQVEPAPEPSLVSRLSLLLPSRRGVAGSGDAPPVVRLRE